MESFLMILFSLLSELKSFSFYVYSEYWKFFLCKVTEYTFRFCFCFCFVDNISCLLFFFLQRLSYLYLLVEIFFI
eukprot:UN00902